jgi:hypothetical protein
VHLLTLLTKGKDEQEGGTKVLPLFFGHMGEEFTFSGSDVLDRFKQHGFQPTLE